MLVYGRLVFDRLVQLRIHSVCIVSTKKEAELAASEPRLEVLRASETHELALLHDPDSIAQGLALVHAVARQDYRPARLDDRLEHVP